MKKHRQVFQPEAHVKLGRGIDQMVTPIRTTLGPLAGHVIYEDNFKTRKPEVVDSGGTIARRIVELHDRDADMGAMIVRHLVWRLHKSVGDCTATAAVLFQAVFREGVKFLAAGGDPMLLRGYLEEGANVIRDSLRGMVTPVEGQAQLAGVAASICHEPALAQMLGDIFHVIGLYGQLDVRVGTTRDLTWEYVEGAFWESGVMSRMMLRDKERVELLRPAVLLTDLEIEEPEPLAGAVSAAMEGGYKSLMLVAQKLSDRAISFLHANREKFEVVAVKTPGGILKRPEALADMASLVGGRLILSATGATLHGVRAEDFGTAQKAWASREYVGFAGDIRDPDAFQQHIDHLETAYWNDPDIREEFQARIGRLLGGSATLRVNGASLSEATTRKHLAERTASVIRVAMRGGILPGGGMALLASRSALERCLENARDAEERAAYHILLAMTEAPLRTIAANAGYDPSEVMAQVMMAGNGACFDVRSGCLVDAKSVGIYEVAEAYEMAVMSAIRSAAQTLTIDVLVHCRDPEQVLDPA